MTFATRSWNIKYVSTNYLPLTTLTFASDFVAARYIRRRPSSHCESHPIVIWLCIVTREQGDADRIVLNGMCHAPDADYRSGNKEGCLRGTRKDVLWEIERWLADDVGRRIFWLNGLAGTGKSAIAKTFAEITFASGELGASFFCSRDFEDRSNLQMIFPTLAFQLAYRNQHFRTELLEVLKANPHVGRESLCAQMEKLIVRPLKTVTARTLIIIDALDECKDDQPASAILSILSRYIKKIPNANFFITGRPETRVCSGFRLESLSPITEVFKLREVKPEAVDSDIKLFFQARLTSLTKSRSDCNLIEDWPTSSDLEILCKKADGFFIYASTVIKFIASEVDPPMQRLALITSLPDDTTMEGRAGVDQLYTRVLEQGFSDMEAEEHHHCSHFQHVVGTILLIFNPLSIKAISELLGRDTSYIHTIVQPLHPLLLIPAKIEDPILTFHKSFPDFLMDPNRCKGKQFVVEPIVLHAEILLSCLNLMREKLRKNICNLDDYAILSKVEDLASYQKDHIGDALGYACQFWTKHLLGVPSSSPYAQELQRGIDQFFKEQFLHWIEVLALMKRLDIGVYAINDIKQWYTQVSTIWSIFPDPYS